MSQMSAAIPPLSDLQIRPTLLLHGLRAKKAQGPDTAVGKLRRKACGPDRARAISGTVRSVTSPCQAEPANYEGSVRSDTFFITDAAGPR